MDLTFKQNLDTDDAIASDFAVQNNKIPEGVSKSASKFLSVIQECGSILDLGCGHDRDMAWFESKGYNATGLDFSNGILIKARKIVFGELIHANMLEKPAVGALQIRLKS